jgi:hypothetical protein
VITGVAAGVTVKLTPLLATPPTVTTTFPVAAPVGTDVARLVALQLVTVAGVPLNVTVLVPCVDPKFVPVIVTAVPTGPELADRLVMIGADDPVRVAACKVTFPAVLLSCVKVTTNDRPLEPAW